MPVGISTIHRYIDSPPPYLNYRNSLLAICVGLVAWRVFSKCSELLIDTYDRWKGHQNIRILFSQPYRPGLLKEIETVLDRATTNITFLGYRYITAEGYRGSIAMDSAADQIEWLSEEWSKKRLQISNDDLLICKRLAPKVYGLYQRGDEVLNQMNWLSGTICALRDTHCDFGANEYGSHRWNSLDIFREI